MQIISILLTSKIDFVGDSEMKQKHIYNNALINNKDDVARMLVECLKIQTSA